jgi:sugar phosphate isomerase/epimerase
VTRSLHPRVSLSAISTASWDLDADLAFYDDAGITNVGISVAKLERFGWEEGTRRIVDAGLRVTNLIGLGPFELADPAGWETRRDRLRRALDTATAVGAECMVFTTGPAGPLTWEEAADALEAALAPVLADARARSVPFAIEHTNSLRVDVGFVHTLRDAVDLARRLDTGVCMEVNACWAERGLAGTIAAGVDRLSLVQVSDFAVGTLSTPNRLVPGDGDIPFERILGQLVAAGYGGCFDLELIGPRIEEEGYESASRRSIDLIGDMLESLGA